MSSVRAQSPIPDYYANMSAEKVERELGRTIKLAPLSFTDRVKSSLGLSTNNRRDPVDLLKARRAAYLKHKHKQGIYKPSVGQIPVGKIYDESYAHYYGKNNDQLNEEARERGKFPRFPITQQDLYDAKRQVNDLTVAARSSAITNSFMSPENTYEVLGKKRDDAINYFTNLIKKFKYQEHKHPGAQYLSYQDFPQGNVFAPPPLHRRGGKSKRVKRSKTCKSKRSKTRKNRVHKRRN
jgi:hypothetical protein